MNGEQVPGSPQWQRWRAEVDLDEYETRWDRMAAEGGDPHGEVDLVMRWAPRSVLDAGCGFGRVAIELAARGVDVVGVDLDVDLLERARRRAPELEWHLADLSSIELGRTFDLVVQAGNVIGFVDDADREHAIRACARHVAPDGRLVIGTSLRRTWPTPDELETWAGAEGLVPEARFADWDGNEFVDGGDFVVTVLRRDRS